MRKFALILVAIVMIAAPIVGMVAWMRTRPSWQVSARNSPQGVVVEVFKSDAAKPTYTTVLAGKSINTEIERANRSELPPELGRTTFYDETLRPGRWTVVVNDTELDIMERALIVNGDAEIAPQE